jgi:uncharacterized protein (TIGR03435 family)
LFNINGIEDESDVRDPESYSQKIRGKMKIVRRLSCARKILLSAVSIVSASTPIAFVRATPSRAHLRLQGQNVSVAAPAIAYEVASIKPSVPGSGGGGFGFGMRYTDDGFTAASIPMKTLIQLAYGTHSYDFSAAPDWLSSEKYDVEAKMASAAADALQKLSRDERALARERMLQELLADRLKLTTHRATKEALVGFLEISKNGLKIQAVKPGDRAIAGPKDLNGQPIPEGLQEGSVVISFGSNGSRRLIAPGVSMESLAAFLSGQVGRRVVDKTGLTGIYAFTLEWMPDQGQSVALAGGASEGQPSSAASESSGASLVSEMERKLGLRLESGKSPIESVVIDHVEKPSGN